MNNQFICRADAQRAVSSRLQCGPSAATGTSANPRWLTKSLFRGAVFFTIVPRMKKRQRYLGVRLVVYLLSTGPVFGFALSRQAYPASLDEPTGRALSVVYYPVDVVADAIPLIGVPLRRYQVLWFRIFSR